MKLIALTIFTVLNPAVFAGCGCGCSNNNNNQQIQVNPENDYQGFNIQQFQFPQAAKSCPPSDTCFIVRPKPLQRPANFAPPCNQPCYQQPTQPQTPSYYQTPKPCYQPPKPCPSPYQPPKPCSYTNYQQVQQPPQVPNQVQVPPCDSSPIFEAWSPQSQYYQEPSITTELKECKRTALRKKIQANCQALLQKIINSY